MSVNNLNISFRDEFFKDKELFEYLGRSIYEFQRLENTLAFIIKELHRDKIKGENISEYLHEIKKILDKNPKDTLGYLIKELNRLSPPDEKSNKLLKKALGKRNYIAHNIFLDNWIVMISPPYLRSVIKDKLKQSMEIISSAYKLSEKILSDTQKRIKADNNKEDDLQKKH
jgi:argonaute-like protein implicated in RNA metabolism and viral defense